MALVTIRQQFGAFNQGWLPEVKAQFWQNEKLISEFRPLVIGIAQQTINAIERGYR